MGYQHLGSYVHRRWRVISGVRNESFTPSTSKEMPVLWFLVNSGEYLITWPGSTLSNSLYVSLSIVGGLLGLRTKPAHNQLNVAPPGTLQVSLQKHLIDGHTLKQLGS